MVAAIVGTGCLRQGFSGRKVFLKISQNSHKNISIRGLLLKLHASATLSKKILQHSCFPVNCSNVRTSFLKDTSGGLFANLSARPNIF